jgi:hypothetical protein
MRTKKRKTGNKIVEELMQPSSTYLKRPVRFLEIFETDKWKIKIYSISARAAVVNTVHVESAKRKISSWLPQNSTNGFATYNIATLIIHEGREGVFAIISWWTGENMLQLYVYLAGYDEPDQYKLFSDNGIVTCVWEMAVLWFERNAWVEQVLKQPDNKGAIDNYLQQQFNGEV